MHILHYTFSEKYLILIKNIIEIKFKEYDLGK